MLLVVLVVWQMLEMNCWGWRKMELINAISMFGYTVMFGIIGIILYSAFKNNSKNRRKGDK